MELLAGIAVALVGLMHLLFLVLEMFLWNTKPGRSISGLSPELAANTSTIAANQGLYNGFLAAGLTWSLFATGCGFELRLFFLGCVIVAGFYGAFTVSRTVFFVQAAPGMVALVLVLYSDMIIPV